MEKEPVPGDEVRLRIPYLGYHHAILLEYIFPYWTLRLSSGYEFSLYEDEFEVID